VARGAQGPRAGRRQSATSSGGRALEAWTAESPAPKLGLDIVAVASRFTRLEKRGSYYVGPCPLHPEA